MKTITEVREELSKENLSTDYKSWLQMLERHFTTYGEVPTFEKSKRFEWLEHGSYKTINKTKILKSDTAETIVCEDGTIFEIEDGKFIGWTGIKITDNEGYNKYQSYMPYNIYIAG